MIDAQQLSALQMTMVVVVDVVVDMVAAAVVAEEILEGGEAVAEVEGVLLAGLATGLAPAAATIALPASTQPTKPYPSKSLKLQSISLTRESAFTVMTEQKLKCNF